MPIKSVGPLKGSKPLLVLRGKLVAVLKGRLLIHLDALSKLRPLLWMRPRTFAKLLREHLRPVRERGSEPTPIMLADPQTGRPGRGCLLLRNGLDMTCARLHEPSTTLTRSTARTTGSIRRVAVKVVWVRG